MDDERFAARLKVTLEGIAVKDNRGLLRTMRVLIWVFAAFLVYSFGLVVWTYIQAFNGEVPNDRFFERLQQWLLALALMSGFLQSYALVRTQRAAARLLAEARAERPSSPTG